MKKMKLRFVGEADFRKNEATLFEELQRDKKLKLAEDDVVMFRSGSGDQVLFVHRRETTEHEFRGKTVERSVIASRRLRVSWGTWSGLMIADYARMVGISLANVLTLEQWFDKHYPRRKVTS